MFGPQENWTPPLFKIGKVPIHVTGLIVLLEVMGAILLVFAKPLTKYVFFEPADVARGEVWRILTYPFFGLLDFFWLIGLFFFYRFGSVIETQLGRTRYLKLILGLLLIAPTITFLYYLLARNPSTSILYGSHVMHLSAFIAFCAMMPNVPSFFGIKIKWFGLAFLALAVLQFLGASYMGSALALVACSSYAVFFIQKLGYREGFQIRNEVFGASRTKPTRKRKKIRQEKKLKPRTTINVHSATEVDRILDKINEHGFQSLTTEEKKVLENSSKK